MWFSEEYKLDFYNKATILHGKHYTYLDVYQRTNKRGKKNIMVKCVCNEHKEVINTRTDNHLSPSGVGGCKQCIKLVTFANEYYRRRDVFINRLILKYGNNMDISKIKYVDNITPVIVTCNIHNLTYEHAPELFNKGSSGCKECRRLSLRNSHVSNTKDYIRKAILIHGDTYIYDEVVYVDNTVNIIVKCRKHGPWSCNPANHIAGSRSGCPKCEHLASSVRNSKDTTYFIMLSKKAHGDLYDYSESNYINNVEPVKIICKKHGPFTQEPYSHYRGHGCPICKSSKGEFRVRNFLIDKKIEYKRQYQFKGSRYKYDFYLPKLNILIEYDGIQHFKAVKFFGGEKGFILTRLRDIEKDKLSVINGHNLIRIKYTIFNILEDYLLHEISKIYKYRVGNKFYKTFVDVCNGLKLTGNTKHKEVRKYLLYVKP